MLAGRASRRFSLIPLRTRVALTTGPGRGIRRCYATRRAGIRRSLAGRRHFRPALLGTIPGLSGRLAGWLLDGGGCPGVRRTVGGGRFCSRCGLVGRPSGYGVDYPGIR